MPKVTVTYFNVKGLGEGIRMLLAYGGQEFEDKRVEKEQWAELKPSTPFGQLPIMEIDGKMYAQGMAICRYLGRKYNLCGADIEEDFIIDQNVDFFTDIRLKAVSAFYEQDEKIKAAKLEDFKKNIYPAMLSKLEKILEENNGYMAAGKLTWADFVFAGLYDTLKVIMSIPEMDVKYPSFKKLRDTVYALPKVKEYSENAPKCEY
ncbi:glutathione S-transferase 2-like [Battus philenor]|uniref:glutathione S-transferase 2-like n=1 Tax=Battus philenor TaxID=42288 RepID=UPI0035CFA09A